MAISTDIGTARLVELQTPGETADGYGQMVPTWTTVISVWANLKPSLTLRGSGEDVNAMQLRGIATHVITMRYLPSLPVTPQMRLKYGSRIFNILSIVNVDEANLQYQIHAKEITTP